MEKNAYLEKISDKVRKGEPVGFLEAIAAINYQEKLRLDRKQKTIWARFLRWTKGVNRRKV